MIIKMEFQEVGVGGWGRDWIDLAQIMDSWGAVVIAIIILRVAMNVRNFLTR